MYHTTRLIKTEHHLEIGRAKGSLRPVNASSCTLNFRALPIFFYVLVQLFV